MEVCSACGGGFLFVDSEVFIALQASKEHSLLNSQD